MYAPSLFLISKRKGNSSVITDQTLCWKNFIELTIKILGHLIKFKNAVFPYPFNFMPINLVRPQSFDFTFKKISHKFSTILKKNGTYPMFFHIVDFANVGISTFVIYSPSLAWDSSVPAHAYFPVEGILYDTLAMKLIFHKFANILSSIRES